MHVQLPMPFFSIPFHHPHFFLLFFFVSFFPISFFFPFLLLYFSLFPQFIVLLVASSCFPPLFLMFCCCFSFRPSIIFSFLFISPLCQGGCYNMKKVKVEQSKRLVVPTYYKHFCHLLTLPPAPSPIIHSKNSGGRTLVSLICHSGSLFFN